MRLLRQVREIRLVLAALAVPAIAQQQPGTLRVRITFVDASQQTRPVPRHALLISENPTTAAPQRVVTSTDGTAEVRLKPANYTVESEEPFVYQGKAYEWRQTLDVAAGQPASIDFTAANAEVTDAAAASTRDAASNASGLLLDWQNSVVTIWSPLARGAGFLIDSRGLIATNQRLTGAEKTVEVQLTPAVKVSGRVVASDPDKDVAIVRVNPQSVAALRPMKLKFADAGPAVTDAQKLFTITTPLEDEKRLGSGSVKRITSRAILSDVVMDDEDLGAPLFNADGDVVAITIKPDEKTASSAVTAAVRVDEARSVIAAAEKGLQTEGPPPGMRLPIEREALFPDDPLREAVAKRKGTLTPYRIAGQDFDVVLLTPLLTFAARYQGERTIGRGPGMETRDPAQIEATRRALHEFGNWWDYVRRDPPVLMIRATPKMVEALWKSILRGAAQTQGVSLPAFKRLKTGFARMQLFCGDAEVTPIHPFKIEHRTGETESVFEGFYIFDPAAVGPQCGTVKLVLFSEKAPDKGDARAIDPKILQQIAEDFAPYRVRRP